MRPISTELRFLFWCSCMASVYMSSYSQWAIQRKPATLVRIFDMFQQVGDCYSVKEIRINCTAVIEITDTDTRRPNNNYRVVYTTCSYYVCRKRHPLVNDPLWIEPLPNSPLECNNGGYVRYATGDESLSCICPKNFKGRFCEIPVCGYGCYNGGTCVQHYVSTKCLCADGFVGEFCETELKLKSCNLTNKAYMGTPVALTTCENQYDCKICETCCRVEDKNVCIQQNTSKQVCIYFGKVYFAGDEFSTTDGKNCTCIPQTLKFGIVRCSNITNTVVKNKEPFITNCPTNTVIVSLDANRNIGTIRNDFIAKDWQGKRLSVQLSTPYVKSCRCHDNKQNKFVIEATTSKDENGHRGRCEFVVETQDETPPLFTHCPSTIYALSDELVSWPDPVAIDNVGVRTLAQLTSYKKKSRFERGEYLISYIAYDWQGNNSKCQFFVIIGDGLDNRDKFSL